jgi:hypothetical protein
VLGDLAEVLRGVRLLRGLPGTLALARSGSADAARAADDVLAPLVHSAIGPRHRDSVLVSLTHLGARFVYLAAAYSRLSGAPDRPDLALLAGAYSRLYDDLFDESTDVGSDRRVADLLRGERFEPATEYENLLGLIVSEITGRMHPAARAPMYEALRALHDHQIASRRQAEPGVTAQEVFAICRAKGGTAAAAFFAMLTPGLRPPQAAALSAVGEILQAVDDLSDAGPDSASGLATPATLGLERPADVLGLIEAVRPRLLANYGPAAHPFVGLLYLHLAVAVVARGRTRGTRPTRGRAPRRPLGYLLTAGGSAIPTPVPTTHPDRI